jgi:hypothetical protein
MTADSFCIAPGCRARLRRPRSAQAHLRVPARLTALLTVLLFLSPAPGQEPSSTTAEQMASLRGLAEQGDADAQYGLALCYVECRGRPHSYDDYVEAVRWYRKAADQGHAQAMGALGLMYQEGKGVPRDFVEGARWLRKAADLGDAAAQLNLGASYAAGVGVPRDPAEAVRWYRKAADVGNVRAQLNLGMSYDGGDGVTGGPC